MLDALITSKTRIKLFLSENNSGYLRGLANEFNESSNSVRLELGRFEQAGLIESETKGDKKFYKANVNHPLYQAINNIVKSYIGLENS